MLFFDEVRRSGKHADSFLRHRCTVWLRRLALVLLLAVGVVAFLPFAIGRFALPEPHDLPEGPWPELGVPSLLHRQTPPPGLASRLRFPGERPPTVTSL